MNKLLNSVTYPAYKSARCLGVSGARMDCLPQPHFGPPPVHRGSFVNGLRVAAGNPMGGTIASCTIMYQVGSRHEFDDSMGVTHFIRAASFLSGDYSSAFMRARYLQQMGGTLTCTTDRQTISYTLQCPNPVFKDLRPFLVDVAARCQYNEYELDEVREFITKELDRRPREQHVLDLVFTACFKGPLSRSIYCNEHRIGDIDSDIMNEFIGTYFKTNVCSVGSNNVNYEEAMRVGSEITCKRPNVPLAYCMPTSIPRAGCEVYDTGPFGETYVALAVPGVGTCDFCNCLKHAILAAACGLGNVQEGGHVWDRCPQGPVGLLNYEERDMYTDYKAFNISYSDSGCFGIVFKTSSNTATCSTLRAAQFFSRIGCLTPNQIMLGKKRLKVGVLQNDDNGIRRSEGLALQAATEVTCDSAEDLCRMIDSVAVADVACVAQAIARKTRGQLAIAVVGDVARVPHDQEIRSAMR